ncbi:5'/3'-nucleotidase SurE [Limisalsivibrio acetivorans]|uniref:5'/3'-nucleotidase SurE n=1 Tax=Limisalsivibrio acetivorans TaxID=1304888 RepID=UPI0003B3B955|nr:5'/3'-nucleotidase SurE [Limisalsivibrio acetivorans]
MKILLTNDDGIYTDGIYQLYLKLTEFADVTVVAPITEQSAVGHAITISDPLRTEDFYKFGKFFGTGIKGTPADCVKLAVSHIMDETPDLVVSGINYGANLSTNVIYSGTVSAATEGAMLGIKSIAVSLPKAKGADFEPAATVAAFFARKVHAMEDPRSLLLNVNVPLLPYDEIKGWKYSIQGNTTYLDTFAKREDPKGNTYYWMVGEEHKRDTRENSDDKILNDGYVSVTPLMYDMTCHDTYGKLCEQEDGGEFA